MTDVVKWTEIVTAAVALFGVGGALVGFWRHNQEVGSQNSLARFENYRKIADEFEKNEGILSVRNAAELNDWSKVTKDDKYEFMSFYEKMALMMQSGLILK